MEGKGGKRVGETDGEIYGGRGEGRRHGVRREY